MGVEPEDRRHHQQASKSKSALAEAGTKHKMTSLTIAAFLTSTIPKCLGAETSLEDLVYDYYAAAWDGPQGRLEDAVEVTNPDYMEEMVSNPDYSQQASADPGVNPAPVKDEFGATLSGMMGALAEIQKKGDSMLAGIRRQREVLNQLEERAALAETRRKEEEAAIVELESERIGLEQKVASMQEAEEKMSQTKSALQPLLSEVSTRTAELRNFESAIQAKKEELERVSKKVEEVTSTLSDLDNKSTLIGGNSPALLALLAGSLIFNLAAGSQLAGSFLAEKREDGVESFASQFAPLTEDLGNLANFLSSSPLRPVLRRKAKPEKRFKDKFSEEVYYDLPRTL